MRQAESEVRKMDREEEIQTKKSSGWKKDGYILLWIVWNIYLGFTAGVFWGIVINLMIKKMCL